MLHKQNKSFIRFTVANYYYIYALSAQTKFVNIFLMPMHKFTWEVINEKTKFNRLI